MNRITLLALSVSLALPGAVLGSDIGVAKSGQFRPSASGPVTKDTEVYADTNIGGPIWERPDEATGLPVGNAPGPYHLQSVYVSANDTCSVNSIQDYDGVIYFYEAVFDDTDPSLGFVAGNDDFGSIGQSQLSGLNLTAGTQYFVVMGGYTGASGNFTNTFDCPVANVTLGSGARLDNPPTNNPALVAEELIIPPSRTITNTGALNIITDLDYSFSPGEVRYARLHCPGVEFAPGTTVTYSGDPSNLIGAVNTSADGSIYFSITAGATPAVATDQLIIDGDRILEDKDPVDCTYGLYDFPSQAQAGGATGRVATTSGAYLRFGPSYALAVDAQGNPIADVESNDPAYSEFLVNAPTFSEFEGNVGGFSYGTTVQVNGTPQPITLDGDPVELTDLMGAGTALVFSGDFEAATDVYFSPGVDCSVNIQSADSFDGTEAVFTIDANAAMAHNLCYATSGDPIRATEVTVALVPVSADDTTYEVGTRGPLDLGEITRNGTELQAPLAQLPENWLSRMVLTNTGTQDREYEIAVFGETGTTISTSNLTGIVEAQS
ncbi:MAG TPA: hypothetical protein VFY00_00680, partial [Arenimonas sp.]|nr:hypothetical protein [Arenimonas sp.]